MEVKRDGGLVPITVNSTCMFTCRRNGSACTPTCLCGHILIHGVSRANYARDLVMGSTAKFGKDKTFG